MASRSAISIHAWFRRASLRYQYVNRIARALFVRLLLTGSVLVFRAGDFFRRIPARPGVQRVLIIVIGGLGDCLLFDPLFRRLKEKWPGVRIDVLSGGFGPMWKIMPSVDNLILFTASKFKPPWSYIRLFRTLYRNNYDIVAEGIAFLPRRGIYPIFTSLVFAATRAPIRIGRRNTGRIGSMRLPEMGFMGREQMRKEKCSTKAKGKNRYLTHELEIVHPEHRTRHESAYIFASQGVPYHRKADEPSLAPDPANDMWARRTIRETWASADDLLIGVTLETTRAIKTWPIECFMEVVKKGIADNFKFVLLGLDKERACQLKAPFPESRILDLTGVTSLGQMISAIRQCDIFLSGDTGPSHIAQACRIPTVVLFGPSNEKEFGPADLGLHTLVLPPDRPPCRPCVLGPCVRGRSCIESIPVQTVYDEIRRKAHRHRHGKHDQPWQPALPPQKLLCII